MYGVHYQHWGVAWPLLCRSSERVIPWVSCAPMIGREGQDTSVNGAVRCASNENVTTGAWASRPLSAFANVQPLERVNRTSRWSNHFKCC